MDLKEILKKLKLSEQTISMILGALVIVVIGVLVFNYFRGVEKVSEETPTPQPGEVKLIEEEGKLIPEGLPRIHEVAKGEDLWKIAQNYFGSGYNWVDIAKENKLANPDVIWAGQKLTIPKAEVIKPVKKATVFGDLITESTYKIQKGDHLWGIAVRAYGDGYRWVEIAKTNNLADPNIILPGNILTLPR